MLAAAIAVLLFANVNAYVVENSRCFENEERFRVHVFRHGNRGCKIMHFYKVLYAGGVACICLLYTSGMRQFNKVVVVDRDDYEQAMYDKRNKQIDELGEEGIDAPTPTI